MAGWLDPVIMFSQPKGFLPGLIQISTEKFPAVRGGAQELFFLFVSLFSCSEYVTCLSKVSVGGEYPKATIWGRKFWPLICNQSLSRHV